MLSEPAEVIDGTLPYPEPSGIAGGKLLPCKPAPRPLTGA
jgi:hypothetical protein